MITVHVNVECEYPLSLKPKIIGLNDSNIMKVSVLTGKPQIMVIVSAQNSSQLEETVIKIQNLQHVHRTYTQWEVGAEQ
ncbi:hypothetical protein A2V49_01550 [candidate division WWE3 bacterium RBG_19FT_COMBO_34_6]|uniref:Transcription regulator AsnC/Lrp ligand binding domain-containing protein n=1 Tax=candidate division WWE3 bacterium RBG_19FT_COMBO_34_6 TaxID=1802612 RepID=A0A1F4UJX3_UNCKA|nr:MAG: hypothetical protein A2V49_01550 [candidate division WWE3 bacterium RBG_19FT_COMBO_34_6]